MPLKTSSSLIFPWVGYDILLLWIFRHGYVTYANRESAEKAIAEVRTEIKSFIFLLFGIKNNMKALSSICLLGWSICPSVHPSVGLLSFLKIGSFVFRGIVQDDRRTWYLVTDEARFLRKIAVQIWAHGPRLDPKLGFLPFYWVCFISFPWNCIQW